ncbi:MAG: restriction endonuclease subunit S [Candidatus Rokuibacteriota bacterium]
MPAGWRWFRLTDLARLETGHTPSRNHPEWWGGPIPWISLADIRELHGKVAQDTIEHTNEDGLANSAARLLPEGTVVLSRTASVGFVTIMGRPMATSQDFVNWVCGPELNPRFLAYLLRASRTYIRSLSSGAIQPDRVHAHRGILLRQRASDRETTGAFGDARRTDLTSGAGPSGR